MAQVEWYEDQKELGDFATALNENGEWSEQGELLLYIQKPWKWDVEHEKWEEFGSPSEDEDGWEEFCQFLDARD